VFLKGGLPLMYSCKVGGYSQVPTPVDVMKMTALPALLEMLTEILAAVEIFPKDN
jgi:hypothetical protein